MLRRIGAGLTRAWRDGLRRLGIGLLVVFLLLAIPWTYLNITLGVKLEEELEEIREAGQPLTIDQAVPKMPPRSENAAYVYEEAFRVFFYWDPAPEGAASGTMLTMLRTPEMRPDIGDFVEGKITVLPADTRKWLFSEEIEQRLDTIKRASQMDRCAFPVNWDDGFAALLPHLAQFREAQRLVTARMMIAAREGRTDEALQWCEVGLRMSEHVGQEPTLIAFLVRVAMQSTLFSGFEDVCGEMPVPAERAIALRDAVTSEDLSEHFDRAMLAERAFGLWFFEHVPSDEIGEVLDENLPPLWDAAQGLYTGYLGAPIRKHDQLEYVRLMQAQLAYLDQPWRQAKEVLSPVEERMGEMKYLAPLTRMLVPALSRAQMKRDLGIAQLDQFRIALMLNVYRQQQGRYPQTLDALAEAMDWQPPEDIFAGAPFHYRREGDGYTLWSIGQDLDDDDAEGPDVEGRDWDDSDIVWRVEG